MSGRRIRSSDLGLTGGSHSRRGARARTRGESFEKALEEVHQTYAAQGFAYLERHNLPTRPCPKNIADCVPDRSMRPMLRIVSGTAPYDFEGAMGKNSPEHGRHVVVEAKSNAKRQRALRIVTASKGGKGGNKMGLRIQQANRLWRLQSECMTLALIVWRNEDRVGILPPSGLAELMDPADGMQIRPMPTKISEDLFLWLPKGSLDYLRFSMEARSCRLPYGPHNDDRAIT